MERGMTPDQILKALWRRRRLGGMVAAVVLAVGGGVVLAIPRVYEATAVVRVEAQRPSEELVQRTLSEALEHRLLTVRQELLARPVLEQAVRELGLYPRRVRARGIEAGIEALRKDLAVKVEGETAFELTYRAQSPAIAAQVVNRLPQIYSSQAIEIRKNQAQRATRLFSEEVEALKGEVSGWERRIAEFKIKHLGELPEQLEMNMRALERLGALVQTKSEELRVAETRRLDLIRAQRAADSEAGRLLAAETALTRDLVAAGTRWTDDHPETLRIKKELAGLEGRRRQAEDRQTAEREERSRAQGRVGQLQTDMVGLEAKAEFYQGRLDRTPARAQELSVLQRDYEVVKAKYQSVVSRKVEAELAEELEALSAPGLFNVVSPAGIPTEARAPDRVSGAALVFLAAVGLGVLAVFLRETHDDTLQDAGEASRHLPVPVLAVVPRLGGKVERRSLIQEPAARRLG